MPIQMGDLKLYSLQELSDTLKLTIITLRTYVRQGKLKARKLGTRWYVSEDNLREFFNTPEAGWKRTYPEKEERGISEGKG